MLPGAAVCQEARRALEIVESRVKSDPVDNDLVMLQDTLRKIIGYIDVNRDELEELYDANVISKARFILRDST